MKQVTMESVKQRIQQLTKSAGRNDAYQISINEERELACLRELVAVTEQRDAVVVENVALKKVISDVQGIYYKSDGVAGYHLNGQIATWDEVMPDLWEIETPATDAAIAALRAEGAYFVANRMLAAWEAGFIDDTAKNASDIARMILTATEFMSEAPAGDFDRSFADGVLDDFARQLRESKGEVQS